MSPSNAPTVSSGQIGAYFGILWLTLGLAEPTGLVSMPLVFWLKDGLGLKAQGVAVFEALIALPIYFGFVFGFLRDRWSPFGRNEGRSILLAALIGVASYSWLATGTLSTSRVLTGVLVAALAFECLSATAEALLTSTAQRHVMSGRLSALSEAVEMLPSIASMLLGGWMASNLEPRASFLLAAGITGLVMLQSLWRPAAVFPRSAAVSPDRTMSQAIRRLVRDRALWPAMGALFLWNFSPGWSTPLVFFLTDAVKISPVAFGAVRAAAFAGGLAAALLYAVLCRRYSLGRILPWVLALNIPPVFLLLFAKSGAQSIAISAIVGVLMGLGNVVLFDLLRRSCPRNLEGSGTMLGCSVFAIGGTVGDLFGSWLYESGGFAFCLVLDAVATAAIFPLLSRVPQALLDARDGEAVETEQIASTPVLATT